MPFPLTDEQQEIVNDLGGELLVSAAAGSGKTRVLVERLLERVTRERLDIDSFLVITYTRAAAAELRSRIAQELSARLAEHPGDGHLRRQATLVYQAQISTIHSFCSSVIRESGHLLDLDPDFRLMDEGESRVLMSTVLDDLLEKRYEKIQEDKEFQYLVDTLSAGRDDRKLQEIVVSIFSSIQSHPDPEKWLREQADIWSLEGITDAAQTEWGALLLQEVKEQVVWIRDQLAEARKLADQDDLLAINYSPKIEESLDAVNELLKQTEWDAVAEGVDAVPFPRPGAKRRRAGSISAEAKARSDELTKAVKDLREQAKKQLKKASDSIEESSDDILEELRQTAPAVQTLMHLIIEFQNAFSAEKRRRNLMDFSDLEHLALKILVDDEGEPTEVAATWSGRFAEILVDEYQDTNAVQNAIFSAVSLKGRKLFQVGDVKQSIYRFRLADPTIFLGKFNSYPPGNEAEEGMPRRRILSRNFRSRAEVLEGCNDLFRNIMSVKMGDLDYTEDQALVPGASFPESPQFALEADLVDISFLSEDSDEDDEDSDSAQEKMDKKQVEARAVAHRIRELLDDPEFRIGSEQRRLRPSDVMLLLRSPNADQRFYQQALDEQEIPWSADGGVDIFATTEVNVALALLQVVDNPHQDVPLIAALRSPVFGFTADKLATLRAGSRGDFYSALKKGAADGDEQCQGFLEQLEELRFGAGDRTCRQLVWHIYEKTNLLGIFGAMDGRKDRQDNLLAFYALAGKLEDSGCRTLFQFLLRLNRMRENKVDLNTVAPGIGGEGVTILSIHRSKGLEKPVVFVCGLAKQFNRVDLQKPVLFHPQLGIGPRGLDTDRMIEYDTMARKAVTRKLEQENKSEEMRLLYVAMTRAKEKLILSMTVKEKELQTLGRLSSSPVSPMVLSQRKCMRDWVLLHLLSRPESNTLREREGLPPVPPDPSLGPAWDVRLIDGITAQMIQQREPAGTFADLPDPEEGAAALAEKLAWTYPHPMAAAVPSKLTATQLKGRLLDQEAAEEAAAAIEDVPQEVLLTRPDFRAEARGLTAVQAGSAFHQTIQYIPLQGDHSPKGVEDSIRDLVARGFLTQLQAEAVNPSVISAFFCSPLGLEMLQAQEVQREFKFSLLVPAQKFYPNLQDADEEILLQGVVDVWFGDAKSITVVDFKTDHVLRGEEEGRAENYRMQLETYSRALETILGRKVKRRVLWFLMTGTQVEL